MNQDDDKWDANPIEKVHTQFIKRILGVNRSTSTIMLRGDVVRYSLQSRIIIRNVRYLNQIKQKEDNILVKQAYIYEKSQTQNRISIENTIKKINNKLNVILNREIDIYELSMNKIKSHIDVINVENWKTKLADSKKADTYKLFKKYAKI